jgi:hypothetical protein
MSEELREELRSAGLEVVEDLDGAGLTERFFVGRSDGLLLRGKGGRVCHAVTSGRLT